MIDRARTSAALAAAAVVAAGAARCAAAQRALQDAPPRAFLEIDGLGAPLYEQQPRTVIVRVGYDAEFFAVAGVPMFRQRFDVPFHLNVPWLRAADDRAVTWLPAADGVEVPVGDRAVRAARAGTRDVGGRAFDVLELRCRWLPLVAGTSAVAPVELRYAFATEWIDSLVAGRQPVDRQDARVASSAGELTVRPLPAPRPAGFFGAVGAFAVAARAATDRVRVGERFDVELRVTGDGNLERFPPPPPPALPGFHVQGVAERAAADGRTFVLDVLALRAGATALPAMELVVFAPAIGAYETVRTEPVPLVVSPAADPEALPERVRRLIDADVAARRAAHRWPFWAWCLFGFALAAAAFVGRGVQARRTRRRRLAERRDAVRALAGDGDLGALANAFAALLQLAAGSSRVGADAADVAAALRDRGLGADVADRVLALRAEIEAARFGGPRPDAARVGAAADALAGAG